MSSTTSPKPGKTWIPTFLLSVSLRVFLLRCVLFTATICLAFSIKEYKNLEVGIGMNSVTILHHLGIAFGPRLFPLPNLLDLGLSMGELAYYIYELVQLLKWKGIRWAPKYIIVGWFSNWLVMVATGVLFVVRVFHTLDSKGRELLQRVNVEKPRVGMRVDNPTPTMGSALAPSWWKYPVGIITGRKVWERRIIGESHWIIVLRGLLAFGVISSLVVYGFFEIILGPVSEMGLTPNKQFQTTAIYDTTFSSKSPAVWSVLLVWPRRNLSDPGDHLLEMASVEPLWDVGADGQMAGPPCTAHRPTRKDGGISKYFILREQEVVWFTCPPRKPVPTGKDRSFWPDFSDPDVFPNLLLAANFTGLLNPGELPGSAPNMISHTMEVYLGFTSSLEDIVAATTPILLLPGSNLVAMADVKIRQRLKPAPLASFGVFELFNTYLFASMAYVGPDLLRAPSQNPNVSTIRLAVHTNSGDWIIVQDFRDKSVLGGVSALGGLGSALSAVFVIWFGTSLMRTVYRSRPYTPFGILHHLENQERNIAEKCFKQYPRLKADVDALQANPGLFSFMLDTLFDVDLFQGNAAKPWALSLDSAATTTPPSDDRGGVIGRPHSCDAKTLVSVKEQEAGIV